jgi:hypothetical protein
LSFLPKLNVSLSHKPFDPTDKDVFSIPNNFQVKERVSEHISMIEKFRKASNATPLYFE